MGGYMDAGAGRTCTELWHVAATDPMTAPARASPCISYPAPIEIRVPQHHHRKEPAMWIAQYLTTPLWHTFYSAWDVHVIPWLRFPPKCRFKERPPCSLAHS